MREFVQDVDARVAAQVAATCCNGGDWGPGEQQTCMTAAALVVAKARAGGGAAVPHAVLKGVCALPLEHFNGAAMRDIVFAWHWIVATGACSLPVVNSKQFVPDMFFSGVSHLRHIVHVLLQLWSRYRATECMSSFVAAGGQVRERLLENTAWAWESIMKQQLGLFSGPWQPQAAPLSSGDLREWDAHAEDTSLISALHAHHQWTLALLEFWEASKHEIGAFFRCTALSGTSSDPETRVIVHSRSPRKHIK